MNQHLGDQAYTNIIADAGYESEENYLYLESNAQTSYIKPSNYERSKTKKYRNNQYLRETWNMMKRLMNILASIRRSLSRSE
jgi:hypothetical protein